MTRDEWNAILDTEPATPNQVGALHREFARLGVDNRPERLAISAALLGLDELGSTTHLVMGQAGQLLGILRMTRERAALPAVTVADDEQGEPGDHDEQDQADEPGSNGVTLIDAIQAVILTFAIAVYGEEKPAAKPVGAYTRSYRPDRADERIPGKPVAVRTAQRYPTGETAAFYEQTR